MINIILKKEMKKEAKGEMSYMMEPIYLTKIDPSTNSNKFYRMIPDGTRFIAEYGRINGHSFQKKIYPISEWYKKLDEKLKKKEYKDESYRYDFEPRLEELMINGVISMYGTIAKIYLFNGNVIFFEKERNKDLKIKLSEVNRMGVVREKDLLLEEIDQSLSQYVSRIEANIPMMESLRVVSQNLETLIDWITGKDSNIKVEPLKSTN
jgi:predicted DNA-binding WGR domain protein